MDNNSEWTILKEGTIGAVLLSGFDYKGKDPKVLAEAIAKKRSGALLRVVLPVGFVDKFNENKRRYLRSAVEEAFKDVKQEMKTGGIHGAHGKHPESLEVPPDQISHLITDAWIDQKGYIFNEWTVIPTTKGQDLAACFLSGTKLGVSTRGAGMGKKVEEGEDIYRYKYAGTDTVGRPSTGIKSGLDVPNVEVEVLESLTEDISPLYEEIKEILNSTEKEDKKMTDPTKIVTNLDKALDAIKEMKSQLVVTEDTKNTDVSAHVAAIQKLTEEKEGLKTEAETLKAKAEEFTAQMTKLEEDKKTIEEQKKKLEEDLEVFKTESTIKGNRVQEVTSKSLKIVDNLRNYAFLSEDVLKQSVKYIKFLEGSVDELMVYSKVSEDVLGESVEYIKLCEGGIDTLRNYAVKLEETLTHMTNYAKRCEEVIKELAAEYKGKIAANDVKITPKEVLESVEFHIQQKPRLSVFREELLSSASLSVLRNRVNRYLSILGHNPDMKMTNLSNITESTEATKTTKGQNAVRGWK